MTRFILLISLVLASGISGCSLLPFGKSGEPDTLERLFKDTENSLRTGDSKQFEKLFLPEGFRHNLTGDSGQAGSAVLREATSESWTLVGRTNEALSSAENAAIVPCSVMEMPDNRSLGTVYLAAVKPGKKWMLLGGGEDLTEVQSLVSRWVDKKTLLNFDTIR